MKAGHIDIEHRNGQHLVRAKWVLIFYGIEVLCNDEAQKEARCTNFVDF